jgi:hypothetical protein
MTRLSGATTCLIVTKQALSDRRQKVPIGRLRISARVRARMQRQAFPPARKLPGRQLA